MQGWLESVWYGRARSGWLLVPLGWLFGLLVQLRRIAFAVGILRATRLPVPVVVVGNLTVGGTGKTPLVLYLAAALRAQGVAVGIVSRGYGGTAPAPRLVGPEADPLEVGDEPCLLARRSAVPVAIGRDRVAAARLLPAGLDVVLADDGLQHYALARDLEIVVVDSLRGFGNGRLLPAGPLREGRGRLQRAGLLVCNGGTGPPRSIAMQLVPTAFVRIADGHREAVEAWAGRRVHALAGIGHPERFFGTLADLGLELYLHPRPDHAPLTAADLPDAEGLPVVMTEKDAVKCRTFAQASHWYLEVTAAFSPADAARLLGAVNLLLPRKTPDGR
jgi:tetraacyldisaccharide 4'-kinase